MNIIFEKIIKLLMLSQSENDHEALSAIRHANAVVKKNGLSWEGIFIEAPEKPIFRQHQESHKPPPPPEKPTYHVDADEIERMIEFIHENAWDDFDFTFVDSIEKNFGVHGRLTWKQARGLQNVYDNIMKHRED